MKKAAILSWMIALASLSAPQAVSAQPGVRLDTQIFVERITTDINGRSRRILASADRAAPGDQLIVIVHWRNDGSAPLHDQAVIRRLPRGAQIDPTDPAMQVSVDGGVHWGRMDQLWMPTPLGGTRRAVAADITHIRWSLPDAVPPGHAGRLSYRAKMR